MAEKICELEADIAELKKLSLAAQRPNIQQYLAGYLSNLKTELELQRKDYQRLITPSKIQQSSPTTKITTPSLNYTSLTKYAWDQENKKVKIFLTLEDLKDECNADQIDASFEKQSVQLRIRGYQGKNLIFAIKNLAAEIEPQSSKYVVKTSSIVITLVKKENKSWSSLAYKEEKEKDSKEEKADPQDSIMNMMKKMYNEGDPNMKKTIAEAWTKANDKSQPKNDFSDRYDFMNEK